jgi:hypothetical protein
VQRGKGWIKIANVPPQVKTKEKFYFGEKLE